MVDQLPHRVTDPGSLGSLRELAPRRIAVLRALHLGDMLCAVPALRSLRRAFPNAEITLVALPWARDFARRFAAYVDDLLPFPGWPGLEGAEASPEARAVFVAEASARSFDLVLQLHGSGSVSNPVALAMGGRLTAGFAEAAQRGGGRWFVPYQDKGREWRRLLSLLQALGLEAAGEELEFPVDGGDRNEARRLLAGVGPGRYVIIHPGASLPSRRWPVERFAAVARYLVGCGYAIVITGSASEQGLARQLAACCGRDVLDLTGRTDLGALAAVVEGARLLVANDTGVSHLAAALGTPSVIVACGTDVERWAPDETRLHRILFQPVDCRPCRYETCPIGHVCATAITAEQVIAAIDSLPAEVAP